MLLEDIRKLISEKKYRIRLHAVRHMTEEGFTEQNIVEAFTGSSKILEDYPEEDRCLLLGYFRVAGQVQCPLHVVCDYSGDGHIDVVTAYIPQKPWWVSPTQRGKSQ